MRHTPTLARRRPITITVVERYPLVRAALRDLLAPERDLIIVAEVPALENAITRGRDDPTDVVLVDTEMSIAALSRPFNNSDASARPPP